MQHVSTETFTLYATTKFIHLEFRCCVFFVSSEMNLHAIAHSGITLWRILPFLQEPDYTPACNSAPRNRTGAYTSLPLGTRLYAISPQRAARSHCSVYFSSFENQIIRYLAIAHLKIALRRIFSFLSEPDYTLSQNSSPRNRTAAYILLPFRTRLYAISPQRAARSHCGVYFSFFQNQIIRHLTTARREISLRRIL